ncbi:unnamed protein product [Sphagnum jensenii]
MLVVAKAKSHDKNASGSSPSVQHIPSKSSHLREASHDGCVISVVPSDEVEDLPRFHPLNMTYEETSLIDEAQRQRKCRHTLHIVLTSISPTSGEPVVHQNLQNWSAIIILS